mmetsp:Transcript_16005/g.32126  ORF Transcript_16005/g.32126 Transcript_16005/m.32126 type:complete len:345 (+) Transcript_16005:175-1209(+)
MPSAPLQRVVASRVPVAEHDVALARVDSHHRLPQPLAHLRQHLGVVVVRNGLDNGGGPVGGVTRLEDATADKHAVHTELHHQRGVGGGRDAACGKVDDGETAQLLDLGDEGVRGLDVLGVHEQFVVVHRLEPPDLALHRLRVPHSLHNVPGAGLPLGPDHRRSLCYPAQRLAEVAAAIDKRHSELVLVHMVHVVGGREHLALVNVIDPNRLQNLRLHLVPNPALGHDRDGHGSLDVLDHLGITHARHPTILADVRRNTLQGHHCTSSGGLRDLGLLWVHDIHDDTSLQHLGMANLHSKGSLCISGMDAIQDCRFRVLRKSIHFKLSDDSNTQHVRSRSDAGVWD